VATTDTLPGGIWRVRTIGLDMSNLNFWFAEACATRVLGGSIEPACPLLSVYLLGDTVWLDGNQNGIQDAGEPGIPGVKLEILKDLGSDPIQTVVTGDSGNPNWAACVANNTGLDLQGLYCFGTDEPGTYIIRIAAANFLPGGPLAGMTSTTGGEVQTDTLAGANVMAYDFGYFRPPAPGTGTIGYWKNHPEAWPVQQITVGGVTYSKAQAISIMETPGKGDKTYDLFKQLVAAKLNVLVGNEASCINGTIAAADAWLAANPVGSDVHASSTAWVTGGPLHSTLDDYNNGRLCAPHRD
jgi:hypothetical protein